jgi:anaerobic dimethyl sulfoxide reductase subunit A
VGFGLDRRSFLKLSGIAAGGVAAGEVLGPLALDLMEPDEIRSDGTAIISVACNNNCGGRCRLQAHLRNGVIIRISTDELPDTDGRPQLRACLKGRAIRSRLRAPGRLPYPMKRTGPRGEGSFQRISWDEAVETIATRLRNTLHRYGPSSVYIQYGTGDCGAITGVASARRLMNLLGGHLGYYNSYSSACLRYTAPFMTGRRDTSSYQTLLDSRLIILNGFNPAETVFETNSNYYLGKAREAGARIVVIDPCYTETAATFADEWLPLKPTTDTALFVAMAHVIISEGLLHQSFLDRHCVGFDEAHMPPGVPTGLSFRNYVMGLADRVPKTPEWAAPITGIDAATIRKLAREYATTRPAQLLQGLGPQRHAHGEQSVRAGITLACMTGNLGIPGGGWGGGEGGRSLDLGVGSLPAGDNPVKARIPVFLWTDAVVRGTAMTADDGVQNGPLASNIKFIFNLASNTLVNQHADINRTREILRDESLVECIVVSDHFMTPSARFADLLLPADQSLERNDIGFPWSGEKYIVFGNRAVDPPFECRNEYDWFSQVARKLGVGDEFTEGKSREGWLRQLLEDARRTNPQIPAFDELARTGLYREGPDAYVAFEKEIADPTGHPFKTPSGKIEIFSRTLYDMGKPEIPGIPSYIPAWEGPEGPLIRKYPLQCIGPHSKRRTHSTFDENAWMEEAEPQVMKISPQDAAARGITDGAHVKVFNDRGALQIRAHVTKRVRPGVVAIPQGAWYTPDGDGVCRRGNINVLTSQKPTPLAHGNAQHTILVEVRKAEGGSHD